MPKHNYTLKELNDFIQGEISAIDKAHSAFKLNTQEKLVMAENRDKLEAIVGVIEKYKSTFKN